MLECCQCRIAPAGVLTKYSCSAFDLGWNILPLISESLILAIFILPSFQIARDPNMADGYYIPHLDGALPAFHAI